jgi:hypothetical protein
MQQAWQKHKYTLYPAMGKNWGLPSWRHYRFQIVLSAYNFIRILINDAFLGCNKRYPMYRYYH